MPNQQTLRRSYTFEGRGLHTGKAVRMTILPAPADTGIRFRRIDLDTDAAVPASAENVSCTARSTTLSCGEVSIATVEHLMSAFTGLGVDNAEVEVDNAEVPILDGSARYYVEAFCQDGLEDQGVPRRYLDVPETVEVKDEKTGSHIRIEPSDRPFFEAVIDFHSEVLGVQSAHWDESVDYAKEIGVCRTFVFFHEIEQLFQHNLIKGGDVDNAIVIVEHPVSEEQLDRIAALFHKSKLKVSAGYLNNLELHFPNECGRHKLLDLMGDMRLAGGYLNAKVIAYKPGHTINTAAAKAVRELLK